MNHVHGLEVIIVQKGAIFTNRMTRPAKYNYWKAFLVFSQFSSISMVYIKKKEVNEVWSFCSFLPCLFFFVHLCSFTLQFLSCIVFSVYVVVLVDCLSLSWFVYAQLRLKQATRSTSYTLKTMQKRNLCS